MDQSENIGQLALALSKVQGKLTHAKKDSKNPFFKSTYADLGSVLDSCRSLLAEHELAIMQFPGQCFADNELMHMTLTTVLSHSSGEWIKQSMSMPLTKADPQGAGSCLTYMRRYALSAVLAIYADGSDDDGNAASVPVANKRITMPNLHEKVCTFSGACYIR